MTLWSNDNLYLWSIDQKIKNNRQTNKQKNELIISQSKLLNFVFWSGQSFGIIVIIIIICCSVSHHIFSLIYLRSLSNGEKKGNGKISKNNVVLLLSSSSTTHLDGHHIWNDLLFFFWPNNDVKVMAYWSFMNHDKFEFFFLIQTICVWISK